MAHFSKRFQLQNKSPLKRPRRLEFIGDWDRGATDKKLDFLSDPIIPSELHRT